jgi:hypothetical protein
MRDFSFAYWNPFFNSWCRFIAIALLWLRVPEARLAHPIDGSEPDRVASSISDLRPFISSTLCDRVALYYKVYPQR